jgi:hypothetical protein
VILLVLQPYKPSSTCRTYLCYASTSRRRRPPSSSPPCRPPSPPGMSTIGSTSTTTRWTCTRSTRTWPSPCPRGCPSTTRAATTRTSGRRSSSPRTASSCRPSCRPSSPSRSPRTRRPATFRWKVGSWISGHYHLRVNCAALLTVHEGKGSYGANTGGGNGYFRFQQAAACAVDV